MSLFPRHFLHGKLLFCCCSFFYSFEFCHFLGKMKICFALEQRHTLRLKKRKKFSSLFFVLLSRMMQRFSFHVSITSVCRMFVVLVYIVNSEGIVANYSIHRESRDFSSTLLRATSKSNSTGFFFKFLLSFSYTFEFILFIFLLFFCLFVFFG